MVTEKIYKVLVVMSTYNGETYLREMIDSIYAQENCEIDLWVRDDGSKDRTLEILEEYAEIKNLKYYTGENLRSARSFFDLLMKVPMEYDFYACSDQDDYWEKDKLITAVSKFRDEDMQKPCLYYSGQKIVDEKLNLLYYHNLETRRSVCANFLFNQVAGCTMVINKRLLELARVNPNAKPSMHDSYFYRLCAVFNGVFYIDSIGKILYRQHGNNVVGLGNSLSAKMKLFKEHLNAEAPRKEAEQIYEVYNTKISSEWKQFLEDIINSKKSLSVRFKLLFKKQVKFYSIKIRMTYILKLLLNKL